MVKCPFCDAEKSYEDMYSCETSTVGFSDGSPDRGSYCYERQIANLKERLEAWRSLGANFVQQAEDPHSVIGWLRKDNIQKLKDLGEI